MGIVQRGGESAAQRVVVADNHLPRRRGVSSLLGKKWRHVPGPHALKRGLRSSERAAGHAGHAYATFWETRMKWLVSLAGAALVMVALR
ncbi:hypothetical protein, partial [Streptomyces sp.]|uniref:hypothetical protein n=1 Tax=Streptomyces sp. TaxID=1931 RepID=UPI002D796CA9